MARLEHNRGWIEYILTSQIVLLASRRLNQSIGASNRTMKQHIQTKCSVNAFIGQHRAGAVNTFNSGSVREILFGRRIPTGGGLSINSGTGPPVRNLCGNYFGSQFPNQNNFWNWSRNVFGNWLPTVLQTGVQGFLEPESKCCGNRRPNK